MIQICIYDNIPAAGGYNIHARTAGFPGRYEEEIKEISGCFGPGSGNMETSAIRYAPLRDGKYLLSWILRHPLKLTNEMRAWHTAVHFLLDRQDADALFRYPISAIVQRVEQEASRLWKSGVMVLDSNVEFFRKDEPAADIGDASGQIDDCILMAGAYYCVGRGKKRQMYLAVQDPQGELDSIQKWLPYRLRKELSFCIGLVTQEESEGTIFNFPTTISLQQLSEATGEGAPMSEKYWDGNSFGEIRLREQSNLILERLSECGSSLQELIFTVITEWEQFEVLATEDLGDGLGELVKCTGQENWCELLNQIRMSNTELRDLLELLPQKGYVKALRKEISRRLKNRTKEKHEVNNSDKENIQENKGKGESVALRKVLWNHALRCAALIVLVVVAITLITLFRQILVKGSVEVEQVIYYCISREAAVDILKLGSAFACGVLSACAGIGLAGSFRRKK